MALGACRDVKFEQRISSSLDQVVRQGHESFQDLSSMIVPRFSFLVAVACASLPSLALTLVPVERRVAARAPPRRRGVVVRGNPFDEILDALDTMVGVSPLSEADLKDPSANLVKRQQEKEVDAPPEDSLVRCPVSHAPS